MAEYIKREDVYEWLIAHLPKHQERIEQILNDVPSIGIDDDAVNEIDKLPAAEPKRPYGKWRVYPLRAGRFELTCPECGDTFVRSFDYIPRFCEHCGADMRGDKE